MSAIGGVRSEHAEPDEWRSESIAARYGRSSQIMHISWGGAWLIGFGLNFLHAGPGDRVIVRMPSWLPLSALGVLLVAAGIVTAVLGVRVFGRGRADTEATRRAKWYGTAWLLGFLGLILTISKVTHGLSADQTGLIWGTTATGVAAILHLAGSGIWLNRGQFRIGIWITVVNIIAVYAGPGWQALILSVAGGGVLLVLGVLGLARARNVA